MLITLGILSAASSSRVYATLDPVRSSSSVLITGSNLTGNGTTGVGVGIATIGKNTGKWYWETTVNNIISGTNAKIGITNILMIPGVNVPTNLGRNPAITNNATVGYEGTTLGNGTIKVYTNFGSSEGVNGNGGLIANGDLLSTALDCTNNQVSFYKNGVFVCVVSLPTGQIWYPAFQGTPGSPPSSVTFNFGQNAWSTNPAVESTRNALFAAGYNEGLY